MSIIRLVRKIRAFVGHSCKVLVVNWRPCTHQSTCFWHLQKSAQWRLPNKKNKSFSGSLQLPLRLHGRRPTTPTSPSSSSVWEFSKQGVQVDAFHFPQDLTHPDASTIPPLPLPPTLPHSPLNTPVPPPPHAPAPPLPPPSPRPPQMFQPPRNPPGKKKTAFSLTQTRKHGQKHEKRVADCIDRLIDQQNRQSRAATSSPRKTACKSKDACTNQDLSGPPAVESSIAVEDAVENRGLYRVFVSRLFLRGFRHYSTTNAWLSPASGLERGG